MSKREQLESLLGVKVCFGWCLDGPGPARHGWYAVLPCKMRFLGTTFSKAMES